MSAINEHLGHQIVVYPYNAVEKFDEERWEKAGRQDFIIGTVFRYLIDGKETGLCHSSYAEALAPVKLEVETYHGCEVKRESA